MQQPGSGQELAPCKCARQPGTHTQTHTHTRQPAGSCGRTCGAAVVAPALNTPPPHTHTPTNTTPPPTPLPPAECSDLLDLYNSGFEVADHSITHTDVGGARGSGARGTGRQGRRAQLRGPHVRSKGAGRQAAGGQNRRVGALSLEGTRASSELEDLSSIMADHAACHASVPRHGGRTLPVLPHPPRAEDALPLPSARLCAVYGAVG